MQHNNPISGSANISDDSSIDDFSTTSSEVSITTNGKQQSDECKANALTVKELNAMSAEDRERIFEEIHGVAPGFDETDSLVEKSLEYMQQEIDRMRTKTAYNRAQLFAPEYVQDRALRLSMLRADDFDATKAAKRLIKFYEFKLACFGIDKIVSPITFDDLTEQQQRITKSGMIRILPDRDNAGRTVVTIMPKLFEDSHWKAQFAACWYLFLAALREPSVQENGTVFVVYSVGAQANPSRSALVTDMLAKAKKFADAMPSKCHAIHYCYDDASQERSIAIVRLAIGKALRMRFRAHFGSHSECQAQLATFGITQSSIPVSCDGSVDTIDHVSRIETQSQMETDEAFRATMIPKPVSADSLIPTSKDVLLGRGRPFQDFHGNVFLSTIIDSYRDDYVHGNRLQKAKLCREIVEHIHQKRGGRFLRRTKAGSTTLWEIVGVEVAKKKISHSFRAPPRQDLVRNDESGQYLHIGGARGSEAKPIASIGEETTFCTSRVGNKRSIVTPTQTKNTVSVQTVPRIVPLRRDVSSGSVASDISDSSTRSNKRQCRRVSEQQWPSLCVDPIAYSGDDSEQFIAGNFARGFLDQPADDRLSSYNAHCLLAG